MLGKLGIVFFDMIIKNPLWIANIVLDSTRHSCIVLFATLEIVNFH
jgi:hypothetical protein